MKILVTGGAGFIGSHMCQALLNRGDKVVCFDNLSSGKLDNIKEIIPLGAQAKNSNFVFIKGDANNIKDIGLVFKKYKFDVLTLQRLPNDFYIYKYKVNDSRFFSEVLND